MHVQRQRTAEQQEFTENVRAISPESSARQIAAVIEALLHTKQAQMGRVFIARQAELTPVHLCDYYPPLRSEEPLSPCAYIGVGFYDKHPDAVDQDMHRSRIASEWHGLSEASRKKILCMATPRARYAGVPSLGEILPRLVYASPGALYGATADIIPTSEEEREPMIMLDQRTHALRTHLTRRIDGLHEATAAWAASSCWKVMWQPERTAMLRTLLGTAQNIFRDLDENYTFLQLQVATRSCMATGHPPLTKHDIQPSLRRFAALIDDIRVRCDRLGIARGD